MSPKSLSNLKLKTSSYFSRVKTIAFISVGTYNWQGTGNRQFAAWVANACVHIFKNNSVSKNLACYITSQD